MAENVNDWSTNFKLIYAYFGKIQMAAKVKTKEEYDNLQREYMQKYTVEEFKEHIKEVYDIKGEVTPIKITNAKPRRDEPTEHETQVKVCKYLAKKGYKFFAVPNGLIMHQNNGDKMANIRYMAYLKSEGLRTGVFDLVVLPNNGKVAFLEMKTLKGKPSADQLKWKKYFDENGYKSAICKGYAQAIEFIDTLEEG